MAVLVCSRSQDGVVDRHWEGRDMELLLSLPWNIEVMLSRDSTPTSGLQLRLDTSVNAPPKEDSPSSGAATAGAPGATNMVGHGRI